MHVIGVLAGGYQRGENGFARLFRRGTSTPVQYWLDFEGSSPVVAETDIRLNAWGQAVVYAAETVDVHIFDSTGVQVGDVTDAVHSSGVEVRSTAFTGTDYETAALAANFPLTLTEVLNSWADSAGSGAKDWQVAVGGSLVNLSVIAGAVVGVIHNVKADPYNAVGDGVTDDSTAIMDADAAAAADGGVVAFPSGTYRCDSQITRAAGVWWWGFGEVHLVSHYTGGTSFDFSSGYSADEIVRMEFSHGVASSNLLADIRGTVRNVTFDGVNSSGRLLSLGIDSLLEKCILYGYADADIVQCSIAAFVRTNFYQYASAYNSNVVLGGRKFDGCYFNLAATSGTCVVLNRNSNMPYSVADSRFVSVSGPTVTAIQLGTVNPGDVITDIGNVYDSDLSYRFAVSSVTSSTQTAGKRLDGRRRQLNVTHASGAGATLTLPTDTALQYDTVEATIEDSSCVGVAINSANAIPGSELVVKVLNRSGGSLTTFGFTDALYGGTMTITNGLDAYFLFRRVYDTNTSGMVWTAYGRVEY